MSEYEPGTVAVATVMGAPGVRVSRYDGGWARLDDPDIFYSDKISPGMVADVRPLVVLDLEGCPFGFSADEAQKRMPTWLRISADKVVAHEGAHTSGHVDLLRWLADRIEGQAKPPRIDEPGPWAVVEASFDRDDEAQRQPFVRYPGGWESVWWHEVEWSDLIDPTLIREGVESDA